MKVTLADGIPQKTEVCKTQIVIEINHLSSCCCMWKAIFAPRYLGVAAEVVNGYMFLITLFALPVAKDNRSLLGIHFLRSAGIVLNLINHRVIRGNYRSLSFWGNYGSPSFLYLWYLLDKF